MFTKMSRDGNVFTINNKLPFFPSGTISKEHKKISLDFAYNMTFGKIGEHREHRSGGVKQRSNEEIFENALIGKLAEFALFESFYGKIKLEQPDINCWKKGVWDNGDFVINNKTISVKSMKFFSNLLLLEKADWNSEGGYIPDQGRKFDFFAIIRIKNDPESVMKEHVSGKESSGLTLNEYESIFASKNIEFDFAGFITHKELCQLINENYFFEKGTMLNGRIRMDASNYYCQLGDLKSRDINQFLNELQKETI